MEKRRLQGDLTATFPYMKEINKKDGKILFYKACGVRTWDSGFKLKEVMLRLHKRKAFI